MPKRKTRVSPNGRLTHLARTNRLAAVETSAVRGVQEQAAVLASLRRVPERRAALEVRQAELVGMARHLGVEWAVIGAALGVTPQAVQKRYGS